VRWPLSKGLLLFGRLCYPRTLWHKVKLCVKFVGHVSTSVDNCFCRLSPPFRCCVSAIKRVHMVTPTLHRSFYPSLDDCSSCHFHCVVPALEKILFFSFLCACAVAHCACSGREWEKQLLCSLLTTADLYYFLTPINK